jgi:hypothetical protein
MDKQTTNQHDKLTKQGKHKKQQARKTKRK